MLTVAAMVVWGLCLNQGQQDEKTHYTFLPVPLELCLKLTFRIYPGLLWSLLRVS